MKAINNDGILNITNRCDCAGFIPSVTYSYDSALDTMTITDASTFPAGDDLAKIRINVTDTHGGDKYSEITAAAGNVVVDTSGLNANGGLNVRVTVITDDGCDATLATNGIASAIANAGDVGN